jgi:serine/threonine protein phosphatase PrpC
MIFQNRVFGSLSLTKSFGDTDFKNYGVNAIPNITKEVLIDNYSKYIILGSDGIWDVINQNHLKNILDINTENSNFNSKNFCEKIVHNAIKLGSQDNISCVVIKL